jgi:hypothetical protein
MNEVVPNPIRSQVISLQQSEALLGFCHLALASVSMETNKIMVAVVTTVCWFLRCGLNTCPLKFFKIKILGEILKNETGMRIIRKLGNQHSSSDFLPVHPTKYHGFPVNFYKELCCFF